MVKINLDVGRVRDLMREKALGFNDMGYKLGVSTGAVVAILNVGEAPPELAARMAAVLDTTITDISTA